MSRRAPRCAALLLAALLAACAGQGTGHLTAPAAVGNAVPPAGPPRVPLLADNVLIAADGTPLPLRVWLPQGKPKAVILALHGFNDYSNAFTDPAEAWAKDGIATYAYDQRGFGEAPQHGRWPGERQLTDDLATASRLLHARHPGVPLYLLGESMGGAVIIAAVTGAAGTPPPAADGIILTAPAVWGRDTMNVFERAALWTGDALFPGMTLTGRGLKIKPSDNIEMLRGLSRDPLVIKETRVDTIKGLVDLMDTALAAAPAVTAPMLLLAGDRDEVVPPGATRLWIDHLPYQARMTRRIALYAEGYHMLLRDLEAPLVLHDVESWIADHRAPLPSGADRRASAELFARR
ncbi:MAG TPA: alpha/beta hydrolase [Stellaceae bacterium]